MEKFEILSENELEKVSGGGALCYQFQEGMHDALYGHPHFDTVEPKTRTQKASRIAGKVVAWTVIAPIVVICALAPAHRQTPQDRKSVV